MIFMNEEQVFVNKEWTDCWNCGGTGFIGHDCGEDTCCCLNPEDNVECDVCHGKGGWFQPFAQG